jgi:hypothetical protein
MQVALVLGGPEPLLLVKRHSRTLGQAGATFLVGRRGEAARRSTTQFVKIAFQDAVSSG